MAKKKKTEIQKQKEEILQLFKQNKERPYTLSDLYNAFNVYDKDEQMFFKLILEELLDESKIQTVGRQKYLLNTQAQMPRTEPLVGVLDYVNPRFGFVRIPNQENDIYVEENDLNGALNGDTVKVELLSKKTRKGNNPEGRISEIIKRGRTEVVGKIKVYANYAIVKPDNRNFHEDLFVAQSNILNAKENDLVIVKILNYPTPFQQGTAQVVEVLGKSGDNNAEMHAIMAEFGLPVKFPEEVEKMAEEIPVEISATEIKKRRDFRNTLTFTIDPADAKDFDDALSFKILENGHFEVGIHIADVSHYVQPGSILDAEAYRRATSVYLVDRTIPMLPEKLSNNLCSLRPNEDKLVFSAVFEVDSNGEVHQEWFGRAIIHSNKRLAYEEAQEVLDQIPEKLNEVGPQLSDALVLLNKMARKLREERFKKGAFNFETNEVRFVLDEQGKPIGVFQKIRKDAHKLIEEFMLLANKRVAEFIFWGKYDENLNQKIKKDKELSPTMVYRVHEAPNPEKVQTFATFAGKLGFKINTGTDAALAKSLNALVHDIEGTPMQNVLESLAVRTMSKAKYTTATQGHFGLAFEHYSHFTSPIRRYPDVLAHRLLQHYLDQGKNADKSEYEEKCMHSSDQEKLAAEAERASIKYKQVEYMSYEDRAKVWEGVVTGVTDFGLFVEVGQTGCEGMVRLADLSDDYYEYDADNYRVFGQRKGRIIGFGDTVKVSIKGTDLERRSMDLILLESGGTALPKSDFARMPRPDGRSNRKQNGRKVIPPKKGRNKRRR